MSNTHKLGFGVTVWAHGVSDAGHLDGIGVYTQALYEAFARHPEWDSGQIIPLVLGPNTPLMPCGVPTSLVPRAARHLVSAAVFGQRVKADVDLFHATDHHIPRLSDAPVVATVMDLIPFLHPEWVSAGLRTFKNWVFKRSILSADHLITISEYSRMDLMRYFHIPVDKISVTPLGVDDAYFTPVDPSARQEVLTRLGLSQHFFLFIGTLQPRKNLAGILDAHALLPLELRHQYPLVVVGRNGWGVEDTVNRLRELEQQGTVRWLDYVPRDDVFALLQSASAMLFMSLYEGFGLPILEAFASQCPVIASNTTSIPEVAGDAALLVDPLNPLAIADAMQQAIQSPDVMSSLKQKGLSRAKLFTWDACAKATVEVYQRVLEKRVHRCC